MRLHWHATDVVRSHTDGLDDSEATSSDVDPRSTLNLRSVYRFSAVSLFWLRAAAFALSSLTTAVLVYTIAIDGSPYRSNLLHVPWLLETIVEYLENVVLLATWVAMRERSRVVAALWTLAFTFVGSTASWAYVFIAAWRLRPGDPLTRLLLGDGVRYS